MRSVLSTLALTLMFAAVPSLAADTWKVDPAHSFLIFRVQHLGAGYVYGFIPVGQGTIVWDEASPDGSSFEVTGKADGISTGVEKRNQHLKSPDFFNAKQFPILSFKSSGVKKTADNKFEVTGDLTIKGKTRSITVPLEQTGTGPGMQGETRTGFEGTFKINRMDYDVAYMPQAVGAEVTIRVALEATR